MAEANGGAAAATATRGNDDTRDSVPSTLYKFMPYPVDGDSPAHNQELRRRVEALIGLGELYWPTAAQLNDPFEASPRFVPAFEDVERTRQALREVLQRTGRSQLGMTDSQLQEALRAIDTGDPQTLAKRMEQKWVEKFRTEFPMVCFSGTHNYIPMWSYYANGHSGVAVHFDGGLVPFGASSAMRYRSTYPVIPIPRGNMSDREMMMLCLFTKSEEWYPENEYRFVDYPRDPDRPNGTRILSHTLQWKSSQLSVLPPNMIVGVTLGAAMPFELKTRLAELCAARTPPIKVCAATLDPTGYKLNFVDWEG